MSKRDHVLVLSPFFSPNRGGVETNLESQIAQMNARGIPGTLLTFQPLAAGVSGPERERRGIVDVIRIGRPFGRTWTEEAAFGQTFYLVPVFTMRAIRWMAWNGRRVRVIHAHGFMAGVVARAVSAIFGVPYVISTHTRLENYVGRGQSSAASRVMQRVLLDADSVLVNTNDMRDELIPLGIPADNIVTHVQWNEDRFLLGQDDDLTDPGGRLRVVFVGRLIHGKGAQCLVDAAARLPNVDVTIIGDGPMMDDLRARATPNVGLLGALPPDATPPHYRDAHVCVVPSLYPDAYPRVVTEAIGSGTPVLAVKRGGIPEAMDETVGWWLHQTEEAALSGEIAGALEAINADRGGLWARTQACVPFADQHYSPRNFDRTVASYDRAAPA